MVLVMKSLNKKEVPVKRMPIPMEQWKDLPVSRSEAICRGSFAYFTGKPCPNGHITYRYSCYGQCRDCSAERSKKSSNSEKYKILHEKQRTKIRNFLRAIKSQPCMDCKTNYHWCIMQFDHRDGRNENTRGFNKMRSIKRIQLEFGKCDLVCANCHAMRTHRRAVAAGHRIDD